MRHDYKVAGFLNMCSNAGDTVVLILYEFINMYGFQIFRNGSVFLF